MRPAHHSARFPILCRYNRPIPTSAGKMLAPLRDLLLAPGELPDLTYNPSPLLRSSFRDCSWKYPIRQHKEGEPKPSGEPNRNNNIHRDKFFTRKYTSMPQQPQDIKSQIRHVIDEQKQQSAGNNDNTPGENPVKEVTEPVKEAAQNIIGEAREEVESTRLPWHRVVRGARTLLAVDIALLVLFGLLTWWVHLHPV